MGCTGLPVTCDWELWILELLISEGIVFKLPDLMETVSSLITAKWIPKLMMCKIVLHMLNAHLSNYHHVCVVFACWWAHTTSLSAWKGLSVLLLTSKCHSDIVTYTDAQFLCNCKNKHQCNTFSATVKWCHEYWLNSHWSICSQFLGSFCQTVKRYRMYYIWCSGSDKQIPELTCG